MKLEDQVASLELCRRLKELGCRQESYFTWERADMDRFHILIDHRPNYKDWCSAFTVAELFEIIPETFSLYKRGDGEFSVMQAGSQNKKRAPTKYSYKAADALAHMLIHLIEKGIIKL